MSRRTYCKITNSETTKCFRQMFIKRQSIIDKKIKSWSFFSNTFEGSKPDNIK